MTAPQPNPSPHLAYLSWPLSSITKGWAGLGLDQGLANDLAEALSMGPAKEPELLHWSTPTYGRLMYDIDLACRVMDEVDGMIEDWQTRAETVLQAMRQEAGAVWRRDLAQRLMGGLYFIIDPEVTAGRDPLEVAEAALAGGARVLQLRDKQRDKGLMLPLAQSLRQLCHQHHACLIINDHADVARLCDADGLHVGQTDLPVAEARRLLEPWQLLGRSNPTPDHASESADQGADHVAIGPIYPTGTKATGRAPVGCEPIRRMKQTLTARIVAIGGIDEDNVAEVVRAGADAVCVSSAIGLASDPQAAARRLAQRITEAGEAP